MIETLTHPPLRPMDERRESIISTSSRLLSQLQHQQQQSNIEGQMMKKEKKEATNSTSMIGGPRAVLKMMENKKHMYVWNGMDGWMDGKL